MEEPNHHSRNAERRKEGGLTGSAEARGDAKEEEKSAFTVPEMIRRDKEEKEKSKEEPSSSSTKPRINMIRFCPRDFKIPESEGSEEDEPTKLQHQPRTPETPEEIKKESSQSQQKISKISMKG